jgi:dTDP-4-dehydrorhamnose reductase
MSKPTQIALTGASGLLGSALTFALDEQGKEPVALKGQDCLQRTPQDIAAHLRRNKVSHLVHCAANTNVEYCETHPEEAYRDNLFLSEVLASACALADVRMIYVSSTGVYGAHSEDLYREYDAAQPTTVHHQSKFKAEQAVQTLTEAALIIRTGWLFGGRLAGKDDFVSGRLREAQETDLMLSNTEQRGHPTFALDVAYKILDLAAQGHGGIFNCVNSGTASRYDYVRAILQIAGDATPVEARPASHFKRIAPVSFNETASTQKLAVIGGGALEDWHAALSRYMTDFGGL